MIIANVAVLVCLAAAATAYAYVQHIIGQIAVGPGPHILCPGCAVGGGTLPTGVGDHARGMKPENILLIGNETRLGLTPQEQAQYGSSLIYTGTLADIIMVLHLDPAAKTATLLSIPRDLFAPMPAGSIVGPYQKIDAALNDGKEGPDNLVAAVEQDLGIPINGYMELNFNGFINSVNALGGINVYFPERVWDAESLLNITAPGCKHLDGTEALALVRARHLQYDPPGDAQPRSDWPYDPESDLARIMRTHTFMKIVAETAVKDGKTNPINAVSFLNAISKEIVVNQALKNQLISLVTYYRGTNPNTVKETTLPTSGVPVSYYYAGAAIGSVLFPVQPADDDVIRAWDPQVFSKAAPPVSVSVVSITGSSDAAHQAGGALASQGLKVTSEEAGSVAGTPSETLVLYPPKGLAHALYVMKYLSGAVMMGQSSSVPAGTVQVDLGSLVNVRAKSATAPPASHSVAGPGTSGTSDRTGTRGSSGSGARPTVAAHRPKAVTTTVPTPDGIVSSAGDALQPWDPRSCPAK